MKRAGKKGCSQNPELLKMLICWFSVAGSILTDITGNSEMGNPRYPDTWKFRHPDNKYVFEYAWHGLDTI